MFNFGTLPFSTSDTVYRNGEVFELILNISRDAKISYFIAPIVEMTLSIDRNQAVIL